MQDSNDKHLSNAFPINPKKISKDSFLEEVIFQMEQDICKLERLLCDYIFMEANSPQYPNIKKRNKEEFYTDFENISKKLSNDILHIINSLSGKKQLNNYTLLMKLLDPNAPKDNSWFRYHFEIMHRVFNEYRERILKLERDGYPYKDSDLLEGYTTFLREMCFDISSFVYKYYISKTIEYNTYVNNQQTTPEENPFIRFNLIPVMEKAHRTNSRCLLDTTEGILHRIFYKDDIHVTPIVTFMIRQMIELRMEECLGIQDIYEDEGHIKIKKVVGSNYFDLPSIEDASVFPIPLDMIRRIYSWASEYVHRGVSSDYWIIYYVKQYLIDFVLGKVYMKSDYFDQLKDTIAVYFNVPKTCIVWRNQPINLCSVSIDEINEIRDEIKRIGYNKFRENECKREQERLVLDMEKRDIYIELKRKKAFLYKIDGMYYIISNQIFEECQDDDIIDIYESIFKAIKEWETKFAKQIREERLEKQDLYCFVPQFDKVREFCDKCEEMEIKKTASNEYMLSDDTELKEGVAEKLYEFLKNLSQEETELIKKQLTDMVWLDEQSIRFEFFGL